MTKVIIEQGGVALIWNNLGCRNLGVMSQLGLVYGWRMQRRGRGIKGVGGV